MGAHVSVPNYQRTIDERYSLRALKCGECGLVVFPPKGACPGCGGTRFSPVRLSGKGKVVTHTVVGAAGAPPEFAAFSRTAGGYVVAIVQTEEGPSVITQVVDVDPAAVKEGLPVRAVFRRIYTQEGVIRYGYKFVPSSNLAPTEGG